MNKIVCFLLFFCLSNSVYAEIVCQAKKETTINNQLQIETVDLIEQKYGNELSMFRADIELFHFSVQDRHNGSYLLLVTEGPEYTHGTAVRANFDIDNKINLSIVRNNIVYILSCIDR